MKRWRVARGLTQARLAHYLGTERVTVAKWEAGISGIRHEHILRLALEHYDCAATGTHPTLVGGHTPAGRNAYATA